MDENDKKILKMLRGNARMSYQEMGDALGMSRVAAKKRVKKMEDAGIIRGYNAYVFREEEKTMLMDIVTVPERFEDVLKYVATRTAFIRQIFSTTGGSRLHVVAVSEDVKDLEYLAKMIVKKCGDDIQEFCCCGVREVIKDVYGGIRYEDRTTGADAEVVNEPGGP
ncbi:MAG: Lrp/AsnC family transcriptional regulator [Lachnospiraceae bacterium]|nr:Lrp/AsnC family transcriptional regulator [Lachnospiraceae bacterium]